MRTRVSGWEPTDFAKLAALIFIAVTFRAVFFTGFFGSDEVTYTEAAYDIVTGRWPSSDYIGSLRYGVNLPVAMFMKLFGVTEVAANLWSFLTSVGEVALVFFIGRMLWDTRAGFLAGLTLAVLPLHVHFAGRMMADAPLAFFMTLSCALFLVGEAVRGRGWFFATGLAAGASFWVKESPIVYVVIFGLYALACRRWDPAWLWMAVGALAMLALNLVLMLAVTGDAWHVFRVNQMGIERFIGAGAKETSPWVYLRYLLLDVRHTWLLGFLAIGGAMVLVRARQRTGELASGDVFVLVWGAGLIGVFSLLPVSFDPVTLIYKQTNYMLMFAAPLALLSGLALSRLRSAMFVAATAVLVLGSVVLSGLEQQAIQVFTANSKASVAFAKTVPGMMIYATTNNVRAEIYSNLMQGKGAEPERFKELAALSRRGDGPTLAVIDLETINWSNQGSPVRRIDDVPGCWALVSQLQPVGLGWGRFSVQAMFALAQAAPAILRERALTKIAPLVQPQPAFVYRIPSECMP